MKSAVRWMSMREQWLANQRVAVSRNDDILALGEVFETSLTFWNSFNFVILLTLVVAHGRSSQKHLPRLLKVMHMCRYRFKGHEMHVRHTLRIRTPIYSTLKLLTIA